MKAKALSRKESRALFEKAVQKAYGIDAQEYFVRYILGEFRDDTSKNVHIHMLLPFAR